MKITKSMLKQLIKEELAATLNESSSQKENTKMKLTKKQLTQIIREELETVVTEDAIERMKGRTQKVSVWKTFCKNSTTANYPKGEDGKPRNPNEMPDELTKCSAVARIVYNELNK